MSDSLGSAVLNLSTKDTGFVKGVDAAHGRAQRLEKQFQQTTAQLGRMGRSMTMFVTGPLAAMTAGMIKAASDAEEATSKFETVFGDTLNNANNTIKMLSSNFLMSARSARVFVGDIGDVLTGMGATQDVALDLSEQIVGLGADLASFTNIEGGTERAVRALQSAVLGVNKPLELLGIKLSDARIKAEMARMALQGLKFDTDLLARAQAVLNLAMQQSPNAIGDVARTADQFANQFRFMKELIGDVAASFGEILLPAATEVVTGFNEFLKRLSSLDPEVRKSILLFAGLAAAIGPVLIGLVAITKVIMFLGPALKLLMNPWVLLAAAIAAVVVIMISGWDDVVLAFHTFVDAFTDEFTAYYDLVTGLANAVYLIIKHWLVDKVAGLAGIVVPAVNNIANSLIGALNGMIQGIGNIAIPFTGGKTVKEILGGQWQGIGEIDIPNPFGGQEDTRAQLDRSVELWTSTINQYGQAIETANQKYAAAWKSFSKPFVEVGKSAVGFFDNLIGGFKDLVGVGGDLKTFDRLVKEVTASLDDMADYVPFAGGATFLGGGGGAVSPPPVTGKKALAKGKLEGVTGGGEVGAMLSGINPWVVLAAAILGAANNVEVLNKVLNPFTTTFERMFEVLEPALNEVLGPLVKGLRDIGTALGAVLLPIIRLLQPNLEILGATLTVIAQIVTALMNAIIWVVNLVLPKKREIDYVPLPGDPQMGGTTYGSAGGGNNITISGSVFTREEIEALLA